MKNNAYILGYALGVIIFNRYVNCVYPSSSRRIEFEDVSASLIPTVAIPVGVP